WAFCRGNNSIGTAFIKMPYCASCRIVHAKGSRETYVSRLPLYYAQITPLAQFLFYGWLPQHLKKSLSLLYVATPTFDKNMEITSYVFA
ncbi:MAG: hypothetical protein RSC01_10235, partial [Oscillospiraceae bacterium]